MFLKKKKTKWAFKVYKNTSAKCAALLFPPTSASYFIFLKIFNTPKITFMRKEKKVSSRYEKDEFI